MTNTVRLTVVVGGVVHVVSGKSLAECKQKVAALAASLR